MKLYGAIATKILISQPRLSRNSTCEEAGPYSGQVCTDMFTSLQTCFSGASSPPPALSIPSVIDQQQGESYARQLMNNLPFLTPTRNCLERIRPFLCLHIFGLCDTSGNLHTTPRGECLRLRDSVCSSEWSRALSFLPPGTLPVCEDLPDMDEECTGNFCGSMKLCACLHHGSYSFSFASFPERNWGRAQRLM